MKKISILLMIGLTVLSGCQEELQELQLPVNGVIQIQPETCLENASASGTRAETEANTSLTYTFEAWTCDATPRLAAREVKEGTASQVQMNIRLIPGKYNFLFWANQDASCYDSNNLRTVKINQKDYTPGSSRDAFAGVQPNVDWNQNTSLTIRLKRPLAKLKVLNKTAFPTTGEQVTFTYQNLPTQYDVLTGKTSQPVTLTKPISKTVAGSTLAGEDFLFVPAEHSNAAVGLTVMVGNVSKSLNELKLKTNYKTKVTASLITNNL